MHVANERGPRCHLCGSLTLMVGILQDVAAYDCVAPLCRGWWHGQTAMTRDELESEDSYLDRVARALEFTSEPETNDETSDHR